MSQLKSFDASGFQFAWDATSVTAYQTCPRKYYYSILQGWSPRNKSVHLIFGGHYASALEHFHKYVAEGASKTEALHRVIKETMIATWEFELSENGDRIDDSGEPWESLHNTKTRETLIRSIVWYIDEFWDDPMETVILSDGSAAVEYSFSLPMQDDIIYCGHIDRLVEFGGKFVQDQKTTGSTVTPKFFSDFTPDNQMSGYSWAGKIIFDSPISGVTIDAAQIAVGFTRFTRGFVQRPIQLIEDWYDNTLATIERARQSHLDQNYPMNFTACGNYGGCPFRDVCSRIPEHRERELNANYVRRPRWDPLEQR